jgi:hypothetical protein
MAHFTESELRTLDSLQFEAKAEPYYDPLRDALRWFDEMPENAVGDAYEHILDLVIVRRWIHEGRERKDWNVLGPTTYFAEVWDEAMCGAPNWPGFKRVQLSDKDRDYLARESAKPLEDHLS